MPRDWDEDKGICGGGVVSICIAQTDDGLRKGEHIFKGVYGDDGCFSGAKESSREPGKKEEMDSSSSEWWEVRGEL